MKDECPKAPVFLYSVNNKNVVEMDEHSGENERTNAETRQELINLNQSLFFSETEENIELVIPFDTVDIGKNQKKYMKNFNKDSVFHQSSL